ncbi:hypothetical protein ABGB18_27780 [Nonomuraea sp. B12E4]|uniref:hypothetical protein n=1 Tax=Nonomuraea sp. B12E4 TaxID=3153564 RepID=UPI00325E9AD7
MSPPPTPGVRRLGTVLALLLTLALTAVPVATAAADPLLSQGRPVTASSTENAAFPASAAVDVRVYQ